jgi:hypothetical protein
MIRVFSAFIVVAFGLPLLAFFGGGVDPVQSLLIIGMFTVPATAIGAPVFQALRQRGQLTALNCALSSAALGLVCAAPFALTHARLVAFVVPAFSAIGALHGLVFWLIAVWRNRSLMGAHPASGQALMGAPR